RVALRTIVSKTGWTSVGELEITRRISAVAVCCSRDSASSRLRVWSCSCASASRFSASASRSSRSRTPDESLFRDSDAAGRLDSTFAFEDFARRRIGLPLLLRRVTIVAGGDDRLCETHPAGQVGRRAPTGATQIGGVAILN